MKKIVCFLVFILIVFLCSSCSEEKFRTAFESYEVKVCIPAHQWEEQCNIKLWYYIKWTCKGHVETLYADTETREVFIRVPLGETVYICAYPLGDMAPFGCAITPQSRKKEVMLSQDIGYIAHLLMNSDLQAASRVNFDSLIDLIQTQTTDFRLVDDTVLVSDVINGKLGINSVKITEKTVVPPFSVPGGVWVPEYGCDFCLYVLDGKTPELELGPGVHRYYCRELDRELRIVTQSDGNIFYTVRYGMTGD